MFSNWIKPKPKTQFDGLPFNKKILKLQAKFLKKELNKLNIDYKLESIHTAYNEYLLANTKDLTPDFFRNFSWTFTYLVKTFLHYSRKMDNANLTTH